MGTDVHEQADNTADSVPWDRLHRPTFRNRARPARSAAGFTLLELLVALAIFAVMAVAVYSSLGIILETSSRLTEEGNRLRELQTTMRIIQRDLEQIAKRPIRSGYEEELPALIWPGLDNRLEFTANGRANPLREPRCSLQRLAFEVKDGRLFRLSWPVLDQAVDSTPFIRPLLSDITGFEVSFLTGAGQVHAQWPPDDPAVNPKSLPRVIRVILEVEGWGRLERLFLPGAD
jgi:general secretion pathway protein J